MHTKLIRATVLAAAASLALAACGGDDNDSSDDDLTGPVAGPSEAADATCDAVEVGPVTRCENFYEDYWPTIEANLDNLYEEAKAIDDGRLVVWDWYELSPDVIAAFNERFPDITVETRGLTYNLSSAVIAADATGERNSDILSGSITSMAAMYDEGFWETVDWTEYGVPAEWLTIGAPELLPDSVNGGYVLYNTSKVTDVSTELPALTDEEWAGQVAVANYNAVFFSGYGKRYGEEAMVELINDLKAGGLAVVEDTGSLLSSGDKPVVLGGQLFNPNEDLQLTSFDGNNVFLQYSGLNKAATNKPAGLLWVLWNAFDPDWLAQRMTEETFSSSAVPFPGLPSSLFEQATGLMDKNSGPLLAALADGSAETETQADRDEWNELIKAADEALNS